MRVCIVIPVNNEAATIGGLVARLRAKGLDVVVVDDGSADGSGDLAGTEGASVLRNDRRRGKGFALKQGFAHALAHSYSGVITMDGDGQHDPEDVDAFLQAAGHSPDGIVTGNRMLNIRNMPPLRRWTNRFMSKLISRICGQGVPDTQCGFRYVGRPLLERLRLTANDYEIETEVLIQATRLGYPVVSVPVKTIYRGEASKVDPVVDSWRFLVYLVREMRHGRHRSQ